MDVDEFFDKNQSVYGQKAAASDFDFLDFIKNNQNMNITLLDVGGGNGYFSELIHQNYPNIGLTVLDPSKRLLSELSNPNINKVVGKLPDNVPLNSKFDYIFFTGSPAVGRIVMEAAAKNINMENEQKMKQINLKITEKQLDQLHVRIFLDA
ncbi:MAG: hypothetical protein K8E24_004275 [Methanobacterium paludis]|nr:hypothetical protein [Methanobacterium paludis]